MARKNYSANLPAFEEPLPDLAFQGVAHVVALHLSQLICDGHNSLLVGRFVFLLFQPGASLRS